MTNFLISGYWIDNGSEFSNYLVTSSEDNGDDDDNVFFYGLNEEDLRSLVNNTNTHLEFVITSYEPS
jgi:hypothetical protein